MSEQNIRGNHNPGQGGWPTIRYFNKQTGYEGASYKQKTSKSVCDELGDVDNMQQYVFDASGTSLCSIVTGKGCSEKEKAYIDSWKAKDINEVQSQLARLKGMKDKKSTAELAQWINQRIAILDQVDKAQSRKEL